MSVLSDTKAAMLRHVPEDERDLRRGLSTSATWQATAKVMAERFPIHGWGLGKPLSGWQAALWLLWDEARP